MLNRFFNSNTYHLIATLLYKSAGRQIGMLWRGTGKLLISPLTIPLGIGKHTAHTYRKAKEETSGPIRRLFKFSHQMLKDGFAPAVKTTNFIRNITSHIDNAAGTAFRAVNLPEVERMQSMTPDLKEYLRTTLKAEWEKHVVNYPAILIKRKEQQIKTAKVTGTTAFATLSREMGLPPDKKRDFTNDLRDHYDKLDRELEELRRSPFEPAINIKDFDALFEQAVEIHYRKEPNDKNGAFVVRVGDEFSALLKQNEFDVKDAASKATKGWIENNIRRPAKRLPAVA